MNSGRLLLIKSEWTEVCSFFENDFFMSPINDAYFFLSKFSSSCLVGRGSEEERTFSAAVSRSRYWSREDVANFLVNLSKRVGMSSFWN
jgi:hypothetical protein